MRQLKHHEQKLLKKVDLFNWKSERNVREATIIRKYRLQTREDYVSYSKTVGGITKLVGKLKDLPVSDPDRRQITDMLLKRLFDMGILKSTSSLVTVETLTVSSFCRRRLPVVMVRLKMSENLQDACKLIEQGHIRVGPHVVSDPAFLVTRTLEDYVTWVDSSKIKRTVMKYNDKVDDYDLLN